MEPENLPQHIGQYEVIRLIGKGGMGRVFLARDGRLDRLVAIKQVPPSRTDKPEKLERFLREAKIIASLNHPHIATVYNLDEDEGGVHFLVMEYIDGETLRAMIRRAPLSFKDTLKYVKQIAAALAAAHDRGIIHRDIKPSNVMIDRYDTVRLLDFGLAKLVDGFDITRDDQHLDTGETGSSASDEGSGVLGTPYYMAPEQILDQPLDIRADVYALGCVIFEMLTGVKALVAGKPGKTTKERVRSALIAQPKWSLLPEDVPPHFEQVLHACLEKDINKRLGSLSVLLRVIDEVLAMPAHVPGQVPSQVQEAQAQELSAASEPKPQSFMRDQTVQRVQGDLGEAYSLAEDKDADDQSTSLVYRCHNCGRGHQWKEELVGTSVLCECGARMNVPLRAMAEVDIQARDWYRWIAETHPEHDLGDAAAIEQAAEGEIQRKRRKPKREVEAEITEEMAETPDLVPGAYAARPSVPGAVIGGGVMCAIALLSVAVGLSLSGYLVWIALGGAALLAIPGGILLWKGINRMI